MARVALLLLALAATAGGCGTSERSEQAASRDEIEGRVVEVREEHGHVTSFVVGTGGERYELAIDPDVDYGFDLGHLHEHRETGDLVLCRLQERDGVLYVLEIHDA